MSPLVPPSSFGASSGGALAPAFDSTLGAPTTSIDTGVNGVPQSGNHLLIVILARTSQAATIESLANLTINGDTGLHYSRSIVRGLGGGAPATGTNTGVAGWDLFLPGATPSAGVFASWFLVIPAYTQTVAFKAVNGQGGWADPTATNDDTVMFAGVWNQTTAVNQLTLSAGANNLLAGSRMSVYLL